MIDSLRLESTLANFIAFENTMTDLIHTPKTHRSILYYLIHKIKLKGNDKFNLELIF